MPALKMKAKSCNICSKDRTRLGICHKSCKISKSSCSEIRISQQEASLESSIPSNENVSSNMDFSSQENHCNEAVNNQEPSNGETFESQNPQLSVVDCPFVRMESLPAVCQSDVESLETIFSPAFELIEVNCHPDFYNCEGNRDADVAHSEADITDNGSNSLFDYQTCNISDFHISDMTIAGVSFGGSVGFNDIMEANPFSDHDLIFDMTDRCMILPFLEETVETGNTHDDKLCETAKMSSEEACLDLVAQTKNSYDQEPEACSQSLDLDEMDHFDPYLFIHNLADASDNVVPVWPMLSPKETQRGKPITLVLDLDETLVHSTLDYCDEADFTFPVFFNMKEHTVYVKQRPYLKTFLERAAEMFELIVFTASQSAYAEKLLNILDPEGKLISRRAYRESCIFSEGSYTKDLTVLGIDLAKVAIIDNSPQVFRLQVNNGIPIKSWFDDPSDSALISLLPFLETLVDADDVRPIIAKRFSNKE